MRQPPANPDTKPATITYAVRSTANGANSIGMTGLEPAASWSRTKRSYQTELHSENVTIIAQPRVLVKSGFEFLSFVRIRNYQNT